MTDAPDSLPPPGSLPPRAGFVTLALVAPFLIPPVVYLAVALGAGLAPGEALAATVAQARGRPSLLAPAVLSLLPIGVFLGALLLLRRRDPEGRRLGAAGWGGLIPTLLLLLWANVEVWPLHLPGRQYPGFPHGLELVIVPLFFVPVAMIVGAGVGAIVGGSRR